MSASTLAHSLPASAVRRWRLLRLRTRVVLILLAVVMLIGGWSFVGGWLDSWPARVSWAVPQSSRPVAISPDGRTMLTSGQGGIIPWDASTGEQGIAWTSKHGLFVSKGIYAPDGLTFAAAISNHPDLASIELIDPSTGRSRATLTTQHPIVYDLAFADCGRALRAFLGDSGALKEAVTWDVATGQQTSSRPITAPTRLCGRAFSSDGRLLALIPWKSTVVHLWDLEADRTLGELTNPDRTGDIGSGIAFSPDGRTLAVGRNDGAVDLWYVPAHEFLKTLKPHPNGLVSVGLQFAPDGRTLASTAYENRSSTSLGETFENLKRKLLGPTPRTRGEIVIMDLANGRRLARSTSSFEPIYSPDGRTLAIRHEDLSVQLHDLPEVSRNEDRP